MNKGLSKQGHWGKYPILASLPYWMRCLKYRLSRLSIRLIAGLSLVLASISLGYAPPSLEKERIVYITDTVTEQGVIIRTDTIVKTVMGPTIFKVVAPPITDTAPFIPQEYDAKEYIKTYKAIAIAEMKAYGIPASITLAQGLIESRAGTSRLAVKANNHFGMKCVSKKCKKGHCINATDDTHKDFFLNFKNSKESYRAHSRLLTGTRYAKLKKYGKNYQQWAYGLKAAGYATDATYAEKLIGIIRTYSLDKYDK